MPDAIFSKGGSASVPIVLAAWFYRIPILIHDSDARAGFANRFAAHFARRIALAYENAAQFFPASKIALTGNPVRQDILFGQKEEAVKAFGLDSTLHTLLIIGGSQGAMVINEHLLRILPNLIAQNVQVVHITGERNFDAIVRAARDYGLDMEHGLYHPLPFVGAKPLADLYALATLVLSRAGAGSIAELAATRKASILIPLKSAANDEQRQNAYEVAERGGTKVIEEINLTDHILEENIIALLKNEELRLEMGEKIYTFYHPDAADRIALALVQMSWNE